MLDYAIIDITKSNIMYKGDVLNNKVIYKFIDFGGMTPFFTEVGHHTIKYAPIEYLISLEVEGYNSNKATKEFDLWAISLVFAYLEGYYYFYKLYFYNPV